MGDCIKSLFYVQQFSWHHLPFWHQLWLLLRFSSVFFIAPPLLYLHNTALSHWSSGISTVLPCGDDACLQRSWDSSHINSTLRSLFEVDHAPTKAHLYSVSTPESGAWLNALPLSATGLCMDNATVRIAVGLRLRLPLCYPHLCCHCGSFVDVAATHGLHCKQSEGRHFRHSSINDIVQQAFVAAGIPSRLEPSGLIGAECKRPNGVTMVPWIVENSLCWDFTCPDTFAPSYVDNASTAAGSVAEDHKINKYSHLSSSYLFTRIFIETMGVVGP